ncbi:MAG TPA: Gfo/Idh/MocA family oxidoreductase [Miltoncostaeaceae bacterium]|nr:Gfo/Idh/MocA family oxidoreductase [Miltoncostaeaceae bacterium]
MTSPLRVAIVGYGLAGRVFHAPLVAARPDMRVAAVVTGDAERAAAAAADHPGARVLPTAEALWDEPCAIDLVVVAAANRAHVPLARAAVAAGLPVVVDKPLAPDAAQARALADEAQAAGVMLTVFQNRRWDADLLTARRLLEEGAVGEPVRFLSRFDRWRPAVNRDAWRERPDPGDAGGLLMDLGSHLIDQAMLLFGPAVEVHGEVARRRPGAQVDDDVDVSILHASGVRSHLGATMLAALPGPRMRLTGQAGEWEVRGLDPQEDALRDGARPGDPGFGDVPEEAWGVISDGGAPRPVPSARGDWPAFYAGVARALRDGGPPPVDPRDAVRVLEVIDAIRPGT